MSLNLNPLSLSVSNSFAPFINSPATSFTRHLPPEVDATCLLLGSCDVRKILYTIYSEQDRAWLLEDVDICSGPDMWTIFHDFYIDHNSSAMDHIYSQCEKLIKHAETMESWANGPWGNIFRMVNIETLHKVRDLWLKYISMYHLPDRDVLGDIDRQVKVYTGQVVREYYKGDDKVDEHQKAPSLTSSFGILAALSIYCARAHMSNYWTTGITLGDDSDLDAPILNPLFLYTLVAGDKFVLDYTTTPLAIYHLWHSVADQDENEVAFPTNSPDHIRNKAEFHLKKAITSAKAQFVDWCKAFRKFVKTEGKMVIRFAVANPIAFCMGLQQQTVPTLPKVVNFSSLWSGKSLEFDSDSRNVVPSTFNVIDSVQLVDRVGGVNALIAIVPLLHSSPESSIYTESAKRPWTEELYLLNHLLCGEPTFMCNLLGIAPLAYLTGTSTRGLLQDLPILFDFSGKQPAPLLTSIVWKRPTSGDSKVTDPIKVSFGNNNFSLLLLSIYDSMFANSNENTDLKEFRDEYTHAGFAALLAFVKRRVYVDWEIALAQFCTKFKERYPQKERHFTDLLWNVYLFGVLSQPPSTALWSNISQDVFPVGHHGEDRSEMQCILLTVPRRSLQPLYKKLFQDLGNLKCTFEVRIYHSSSQYRTYLSPIPIFGKLVMSANGENGTIEPDPAGWHGKSDLLVCVYGGRRSLLKSLNSFISLNIISNETTRPNLKAFYGRHLEIFTSSVLDRDHVQILDSIPGYSQPKPARIPNLTQNDSQNGLYRTHADLSVSRSMAVFTVRLTVLTEVDHEAFLSGAQAKADQISPCIIDVRCGSVQHQCQFPYPIDGAATVIRISRKQGWIEICAPLTVPKHPIGGYSSDIYPIAKGVDGTVCSWNLPSINFTKLPAVNELSTEMILCYNRLFLQMFSDAELGALKRIHDSTFGLFSLADPDGAQPLSKFKVKLSSVFRTAFGLNPEQAQRTIGISVNKSVKVLLFVTGLYMDPASHSVVIEAYLFEPTPEQAEARAQRQAKEGLALSCFDVTPEQFKIWKLSFRPMAERCRDWEHSATCEYAQETMEGLCSCGKGKPHQNFLDVKEWADFAQHVVRCAISPAFPAPFLEQTREASCMEYEDSKKRITKQMEEAKACSACGIAGKTKKCGRCEKAYYCNRECQIRHWKWHKTECTEAKH